MANKRYITAHDESISAYIKKVWLYRDLIFLFAERDIKVKYAQTFLGVGWTLLQPVTGLIIFTIFFDRILSIDTGSMPYPVYAFLGLSAWTFFMSLFNQASTAVIDNQVIISKAYFPKIILNLSKVITSGFDFLLSTIILIVLLPFYHYIPSWHIVFLPFFITLNIMVGLTASLWLSALAHKKRDLFHIIPYVSNFGIWLTPVFYNINMFPEQFRFVFYFNPMVTVIEGYRWCLSGGPWPDYNMLYCIIVLLAALVAGLFYFKKVEDKFIDHL